MQMWTTAPLPHLWNPLKAVQLKRSVWLRCKILGLFVNPFTAHGKYSPLNRDNLMQHLQIQLSQKKKVFRDYFFAFSKFTFNFEHFQTKDGPHSWCIFWTYGLEKIWLDNCLKSPISEDPSTSNMVKRPKHCWNLNGSTFTKFIHHCESNSIWKTLPEGYAKS